MSRHILEENSNAQEVPRRIALIRREAPARLLENRGEAVPTAPHLLMREIVLFQLCIAALAVISLLFNAPLEGMADQDHTPNPAKAPWYFLGLQELLHYFPPVVAGVLLPGLVVIALIIIPYVRINLDVIGFFERPWRTKLAWISLFVLGVTVSLAVYEVWPVLVPTVAVYMVMILPAVPGCPHRLKVSLGRLPLADWLMLWFVLVSVALTMIGTLFRGPGWSWVLPWRDGIF